MANELVNLATQLDPAELTRIGNQCVEDFQADYDSSAEMRTKRARWAELYLQTDKSAVKDWQSDASIPILAEACNQFQARAFKAFFPSRDFIQAVPYDATDDQGVIAAEKIAKRMNYELSVVDRNYKPDKNAMFLAAALQGSDFTKVYYDPLKGKKCVERIDVEDLILPYAAGQLHIDDIERKTHILYRSVNDTAILAAEGFFIDKCEIYDGTQRSEKRQVEDDAQGIIPSRPDNYKMACILEQHTLLDLDGDGIAEPYIVWIDRTTSKVKRIQIRYETDAQGNATNNKKPIEYFNHYRFLTNPNGVYGLGYGHIVGKLNETLNVLIRQIVDAGTLANIGNMSGFVDERLGLKGGDLEMDIGVLTKMPRNVEDIRKAIYTFQFPGANPSLVQTFDRLVQTAQRASSTTDSVTGDINKVMQPLSIMTLLESSLQMPSSVMEQMALSFEGELQKLYNLDKKHTTYAQGIIMDGKRGIIGPDDYKTPVRVTPIVDPRNITRQQKVAKNQQLFEFAMNNPVLSTDENAMKEITKRNLIALDVEDVDKIMPSAKEPLRFDDQDEENMYFILPSDERPYFDVFEDQNHAEHIQKIDGALVLIQGILQPDQSTPLADPVVIQAIMGMSAEEKMEITTELMKHRRKHVAYLYRSMTSGQGQPAGMAPAGANPMGIQPTTGDIQPPAGASVLPGGGSDQIPGPMAGPGEAMPGIPLPDPGILGLSDTDVDPRT